MKQYEEKKSARESLSELDLPLPKEKLSLGSSIKEKAMSRSNYQNKTERVNNSSLTTIVEFKAGKQKPTKQPISMTTSAVLSPVNKTPVPKIPINRGAVLPTSQ